ncbi:hypothetical protein [Sphingomonas sp.]|uniref:hypothetical protein n=1 Tax=Sphingomonas sp. TaxID=28214 RepID=UPI0025E6BA39|nr:hypothetical protein [Sphingomonas sp.]
MSKQNDMDYYQGRALHERELASISADASIARIHGEMAEHYEKIVAGAKAEAETLPASFGGG